MQKKSARAALRPAFLVAIACFATAFLGALDTGTARTATLPASATLPDEGAGPPPPPDADVTVALLGENPRIRSYTVTRSGDGKWIRLSAQAETAYPVGASTITEIVENYVGASKIFSRIGWVKIIDKVENGTITEQFSGVKAFGFKFYTTNRFRQWTSGENDYTVMHFLQVASGGTMRNCSGYWAVADRSTPDKPMCYLDYSLSFEALDQFPGQESVMRGFGEADVLLALKELGQAAEKTGK
ncbi:MAG TPA: hypothetical protein VMV83_03585 [Rectinemataceae bacterium]|nr:hypothetical protein [Rectinemataceae bacterium]